MASRKADDLASQIFEDKPKEISNLIIAVITIRTNNLVPKLREKSGKYVRLSELRQPILESLFKGDLEEAKKLFIALVDKYGRDVVTPYTLKLLGLSDKATKEDN